MINFDTDAAVCGKFGAGHFRLGPFAFSTSSHGDTLRLRTWDVVVLGGTDRSVHEVTRTQLVGVCVSVGAHRGSFLDGTLSFPFPVCFHGPFTIC